MKQKTQGEKVDCKTRQALHKEVEDLHDSLDALKLGAATAQSSAQSQFSQIEEIEREIVSMYNEIEERFEEHEVSLISKGAVDLTNTLVSGTLNGAASLVKNLSHNIHFLFLHRRPSMRHRKVIHLAMKIVDHAKEVISSSKVGVEQLRLIHLLQTLLEEALYQAKTAISPEEAELAMELYEIADLLYHRKEREGKLRLKLIAASLTEAQRARLEAASDAPKEMVRILLEIAGGGCSVGVGHDMEAAAHH